MIFRVLLLGAAVGWAAPAVAGEPKAVIYDMELLDTSAAARPAAALSAEEKTRLALASGELRKLLGASGKLTLVDPAPQAERIAKEAPLFKCHGCELDIARDLGADWAVSSFVQKTSNLILAMGIVVTDAKTGKVVRAGTADIRGNTDETWLRGVRWLIKNRILDPPLPETP